jgi:hypothetical protein
MDRNFVDLLSALNSHGARYLVVGGYAVSYHSQPRGTKDMDIFYSTDKENTTAVFQALAEFGAPMAGIGAEDFADPEKMFRFGRPPYQVDFLPMLTGVDFEDAWRTRVMVAVTDEIEAPYISSDQLKENKRAFGRLQDLADVEAIEHCERVIRMQSEQKEKKD